MDAVKEVNPVQVFLKKVALDATHLESARKEEITTFKEHKSVLQAEQKTITAEVTLMNEMFGLYKALHNHIRAIVIELGLLEKHSFKGVGPKTKLRGLLIQLNLAVMECERIREDVKNLYPNVSHAVEILKERLISCRATIWSKKYGTQYDNPIQALNTFEREMLPALSDLKAALTKDVIAHKEKVADRKVTSH